jgi:hypothetical protein
MPWPSSTLPVVTLTVPSASNCTRGFIAPPP